jgi:histidine triad (HIT) family protein
MDECLFCKIIRGEVPSEKIYEDAQTYAFLDINPVNHGHTLVIPKTHAQDIRDISHDSFLSVMNTVWKLSSTIREALGADGINIAMNNGMHAGQLVDHVHLHIIPRFAGDGYTHWKGAPYNDGEVSQIAEKIKNLLN